MYLGLKHFRVPPETLRVVPTMFSDDQLRAMRVPMLLLIGDHEVLCDAATALARARRLIPDCARRTGATAPVTTCASVSIASWTPESSIS